MTKQHKKERDFGGRGKEDWHKLHDSVDPSRGLTRKQTERLQRFLQIIGNTVKIDPLGRDGKSGVYYRKSKTAQEISIHTVAPEMLKRWFKNQMGTENVPVYESTVSNFIAQNPRLILKDDNEQVTVWREQDLGDSKKAYGSRVDIIFQTERVVYVIEVKFTSTPTGALGALEKAVNSVKDYGKRIEKLGWWSDKELKLVVVWATADDVPHYSRSFYKQNEISSSFE